MHAAARSGGARDPGRGSLDALLGIGDHEPHAAQPATSALAQERRPERLGHCRPDVHARHLAPTVAGEADGDDHRGRDDAARLPELHRCRVQPETGPDALDGRSSNTSRRPSISVHERGTRLVRMPVVPSPRPARRRSWSASGVAAQPRTGPPGRPRCAPSPRPARVEEARDTGALPGPGDAQLDRAGAGPSRPRAPPRCAPDARHATGRHRSARRPRARSGASRRRRSPRAGDRPQAPSRSGAAGASSQALDDGSSAGSASPPDPTDRVDDRREAARERVALRPPGCSTTRGTTAAP